MDHGPRTTHHAACPVSARRLSLANRQSASAIGKAAFTLLEILVSVALLSFIVLGLFAMFNQIQRAFRSSMTQSDILEAGRAVTEMIPRELEQMVPSRRSPYPLNPYTHGVNFYAEIPNSTPLTQPLPGNPLPRTNLLQDCFMLLRQNQTWIGIGYCVRTIDTNDVLWYPETPGSPAKWASAPSTASRKPWPAFRTAWLRIPASFLVTSSVPASPAPPTPSPGFATASSTSTSAPLPPTAC